LKIAILAYFGLFFLEILSSDFGFFFANRKYLQSSSDSENLKKIAKTDFEKNALKVGKNAFSTLNIFALSEALTMA